MATTEPGEGFLRTLRSLPAGPFSTADFIQEYRSADADEWQALEREFGAGGRGAGQYHTVFTRVAKWLSKISKTAALTKLDYRQAPDWWGNGSIQFWSTINDAGAEENKPPIDAEYREGTVKLKAHLRKERAWGLAKAKRTDFLAKHGRLFCERCKLDPTESFGPKHGASVIEVHHAATMVSGMKANHRTKLDDLQCLCANCHRLTHAELACG